MHYFFCFVFFVFFIVSFCFLVLFSSHPLIRYFLSSRFMVPVRIRQSIRRGSTCPSLRYGGRRHSREQFLRELDGRRYGQGAIDE